MFWYFVEQNSGHFVAKRLLVGKVDKNNLKKWSEVREWRIWEETLYSLDERCGGLEQGSMNGEMRKG